MRGADTFTESLFTMRRLEDFVPANHPLRPIRAMVNEALLKMDNLFAGMYEADTKGAGAPASHPRSCCARCSCRSSSASARSVSSWSRPNTTSLYRWFIGLAMDDAVWVPSVFTKNRERLIAHDAIIELFNHIVETADRKGWLSGEHFSVDCTLIQAWASHRSFVRKDGGDDDAGNNTTGSTSFKGQSRSNDTHASRTDGDARLYRKGKTASELRYMGHTLSDNRHGLIANAMVTQADGFAEREAAKVMIKDARQAAASPDTEVTLGADKGYDAQEFVQACQDMGVIPHVAQNTSGRRSAVPDAIAASEGYALSQRKRKLIEQGFGWAKTVGGIRQVMVRGLKRVDHLFVLTMTAYNLTRMRSLGQIRAQGL